MLIICDRHKIEDLELWDEYEEADAIRAQSPQLEKMEESAIAMIVSFMERGGWVGVSWGKDSTVLAHLAWRSATNPVLAHVIQRPSESPHCKDVAKMFFRNFPMTYMEDYADYSAFLPRGPEWEKQTDSAFFGSIRRLHKILGDRHITGIRGEESAGRLIRQKVYGPESTNTLAPLTYWKNEDVFAYLKKYDLPVHPDYAMLGGGRWDRRKRRVDALGGSEGDGFGRTEWDREYYPDLLNRLDSQNPKTALS